MMTNCSYLDELFLFFFMVVMANTKMPQLHRKTNIVRRQYDFWKALKCVENGN